MLLSVSWEKCETEWRWNCLQCRLCICLEKQRGISWLAEQLLGSEGGWCYDGVSGSAFLSTPNFITRRGKSVITNTNSVHFFGKHLHNKLFFVNLVNLLLLKSTVFKCKHRQMFCFTFFFLFVRKIYETTLCIIWNNNSF